MKRVECKTGRVLYQVTDIILEQHKSISLVSNVNNNNNNNNNNTTTTIQPYTCFTYPRYCSCPEFFNSTVSEQQTLMVKEKKK